ncbi:hypothetical protein CV_0990 [Chromobacterium violaceum ATCC 12472]|uniref:Uncharacterized protein n=1 Tax=Chromobacterium violaceum (strain ATCC 12472 / DSM 30191 / JCM 1249 / CCUG 213 / NBRC 12614 / NCIMB 9131 / NCTC 9757 / MK) TaxID=243365 RepID=Q7NZD2_CHRVO|nr:hypothetical protein CV_0990 [Chromobacterium violaceum ATCC 12472]
MKPNRPRARFSIRCAATSPNTRDKSSLACQCSWPTMRPTADASSASPSSAMSDSCGAWPVRCDSTAPWRSLSLASGSPSQAASQPSSVITPATCKGGSAIATRRPAWAASSARRAGCWFSRWLKAAIWMAMARSRVIRT